MLATIFLFLSVVNFSTTSFEKQLQDYQNVLNNQHFESIDPEAYMTVSEIIKYNGYPVEEHTVVTRDGYILTVQRIPHGKNGARNAADKVRKPVLVQHGLFGSSAMWVVNNPDKNLPYLLADAGYDVWLGNVRGNCFGNNNTHLNPDEKQFWQFSFDEMAEHDIPAIIHTMLNVTGFEQIYYVGHSMGTTILFALLSSQPHYNNIIKAGFTLAPVVSPRNVHGPIRFLHYFAKQVFWIDEVLAHGKFYLDDKLVHFLARTLCDSPFRFICENVLFLICGYDPAQTNGTRLPVMLYHAPDATSFQTLYHYSQLFSASHFQYYDYGNDKDNHHHYNQSTPPIYDLAKITTPISLFWSSNDRVADPTDVSHLIKQLKNVPLVYHVPYAKFNHLDFLWAEDVKPLLYNKLLQVMGKLWP